MAVRRVPRRGRGLRRRRQGADSDGQSEPLRPGQEPARAYDDNLPLEVRVEREAVPFTLAMRVQIGRHFSKLAAAQWPAMRQDYLTEYAFATPAANSEAEAQLMSDGKAQSYLAAVAGRFPDGAQLLTAIDNGDHATFVAGLGLGATEANALIDAADGLAAWFARLYSLPDGGEQGAWQPARLEYRFACAAAAGEASDKQAVLEAEQHPGGHLDWPAFDIDPRASAALKDAADAVIAPRPLVRHDPISFLPAPIEYGGMPHPRWWQFEDRKTDFGQIRASTTDPALLLLAEFGLIYGNDWSLVPYDLEVGSLAEVLGVVVTDVFGARTFIRRAGTRDSDGWQHWNMYDLKNRDVGVAPQLLLPPAIVRRDEGRPIDKVALMRDEMANLVFGMEEVIPGPIGHGIAGAEAAAALARHLWDAALAAGHGPPATVETGALIHYQAGVAVPENWIPFLAIHLPGADAQIRLQRGRMAREVPLAPSPTVEPRGGILRHGLDQAEPEPYFIHEEEVPRAGALVSRAFQRTRWYDGRVFTWLGRHKWTGRGEGLSGLRFDQIAPREAAEE